MHILAISSPPRVDRILQERVDQLVERQAVNIRRIDGRVDKHTNISQPEEFRLLRDLLHFNKVVDESFHLLLDKSARLIDISEVDGDFERIAFIRIFSNITKKSIPYESPGRTYNNEYSCL